MGTIWECGPFFTVLAFAGRGQEEGDWVPLMTIGCSSTATPAILTQETKPGRCKRAEYSALNNWCVEPGLK